MTSPIGLNSNEYSYDSGRRPFKPDVSRGKWSSIWDFYFASIGHSFGYVNLILVPILWSQIGGALAIFATIISILFCVIPVFFIQSSIGQFSSSGYLSVFRISPMFKGIGYVILFLNLITVEYYSILTAFPLVYIFSSLRSELPWMNCTHSWNTVNCTEIQNGTFISLQVTKADENPFAHTPPMEYFRRELLHITDESPVGIAWPLVGCLVVVWTCVAFFVMDGIEMVEKGLRYLTLTGFALFSLIFIRFALLLDNGVGLIEMFMPPYHLGFFNWGIWVLSPIVSVMSFGTGWGNVITLASYNDFKTDVVKYSFIIPFVILGLTIFSALFMGFLLEHAMNNLQIAANFWSDHLMEMPYVLIAFLLGTLEIPQFWSIVFYSILFLFSLNAVIVQVFTICTALFDEYEKLRTYKRYFSLGLCLFLFLMSTTYATKHGFSVYKLLSSNSGSCNMLVCFMEIMVVIWVYGRLRFQRDITFMVGKVFQSWKFYIIRFVTPIYIIIIVIVLTLFTFFSSMWLDLPFWAIIVGIAVNIVPWVAVPGYIIYQLSTTTGTVRRRFQKSARPNDWYPVDPVNREKYERTLNNLDTTHQLLHADETVND